MNRLLQSRAARSGGVDGSPWLQDEFLECYVHWRAACIAVRVSYDHWKDAEPDVERFAYAAHVAALDREERAADVYRECAHRIAPRG